MRLPVRETIATGTANVYEVTAENVLRLFSVYPVADGPLLRPNRVRRMGGRP